MPKYIFVIVIMSLVHFFQMYQQAVCCRTFYFQKYTSMHGIKVEIKSK